MVTSGLNFNPSARETTSSTITFSNTLTRKIYPNVLVLRHSDLRISFQIKC